MYDLDILKQLIDPVTKSSSKIHSTEDIGHYIYDTEGNIVLQGDPNNTLATYQLNLLAIGDNRPEIQYVIYLNNSQV